MSDDPKKTRHWAGPGAIPPENPFVSPTRPEHAAVTQEQAERLAQAAGARRKETRALHDVKTLVDLDENLATRLQAMTRTLQDENRVREQRTQKAVQNLSQKVDSLADRLEVVESGTGQAVRDSSHSLEKSRELSQMIVELRRHSTALESAPKSEDMAQAFKEASGSASAEFAGLIADVRSVVKRWGFVFALAFGAISAAASYLGGHGTAKEAAETAVQSAPRPAERIVIVPTQPAQTTPQP